VAPWPICAKKRGHKGRPALTGRNKKKSACTPLRIWRGRRKKKKKRFRHAHAATEEKEKHGNPRTHKKKRKEKQPHSLDPMKKKAKRRGK